MPSLASNIQFHDHQFKYAVPQGTWRWTTRVDVSGSLPAYQIRDVVSPFGLLRDNIPLPGPVVTAMANSITELQSAFAPTIVTGADSLTFTLTEGQGFGPAQTLTITNGGVYGSLLAASITSSAAFLKATPANLGNLAFNVTGSTDITADSTAMLAVNSPYTAQLTIQDDDATNSPQIVSVSVVVLPKATISVTPTALAFSATGNYGDPFPPVPAQSFQLTNSGPPGSVLEYEIQKLTGLSDWLVGYSPMYGTLASGASQNITVLVAPGVNTLPGTYTETLRVSGYSSNLTADVVVTLTIS